MVPQHSILGTCPNCHTSITVAAILIEYETANERRVYAECPSCRDVIHPE